MRLFDAEQYLDRRMNRKKIPDLKPTGEPCAVKVACTVRRGEVAKVLLVSNSVASYPTFEARAVKSANVLVLKLKCDVTLVIFGQGGLQTGYA